MAMSEPSFLFKPFPQNFIIRSPFRGAAILAIFNFLFLLLYRPLSAHGNIFLSYEAAMAVYSSIGAFSVWGIIQILKSKTHFLTLHDWTFLKELTTIVILLAGMGIAVYLTGFISEPPANRWNWNTFLDSFKNAFLTGILPFAYFTGINLRYLFPAGAHIEQELPPPPSPGKKPEKLIQMTSKLKKESLSFYPSEFIYAVSDANYIDFYLLKEGRVIKKTIRNSMNNVMHQFSEFPYVMRTHRAFIVNLNKIRKKKGNALGYQLTLEGIEETIPVSRQNIAGFDETLEKYLN